jgi:transcriptional regulator with XRE-family HTH domain
LTIREQVDTAVRERRRFLRQALGWQQKRLAFELGVTPETVSRWEGDKKVISQPYERMLRILAGSRLCKEAPEIHFDLEAIASMPIRGPRGTSEDIAMSFCRTLVACNGL